MTSRPPRARRLSIRWAAAGLLTASLVTVASTPMRAAETSSPLPAANDDDSQSNEYTEKLGNFFDGGIRRAKKFVGLGKAPAPPPLASPSGCPEITVLDGTGAQRVMANAAAGNAGLRHQFSITEVARECQLSGARMVVKVGVEGRVLLGPAGTPGTFGVPVRVAIVDRMSEKPFLSRLFKVAATIPAGQSTTDYSLVADSLVVPFAAGRTAQDYSIKIGIDSAGGGDVAAKPARHHKAKAVAQGDDAAAATPQ